MQIKVLMGTALAAAAMVMTATAESTSCITGYPTGYTSVEEISMVNSASDVSEGAALVTGTLSTSKVSEQKLDIRDYTWDESEGIDLLSTAFKALWIIVR